MHITISFMNMIPLKIYQNNIGGYNIIKYQELSPINLFYNKYTC